MAGTKISSLDDGGQLQGTDTFPIARGSYTRKIQGSVILNAISNVDTKITNLSSNLISVNDSATIDLNYNSSTRVLSAEVKDGSITSAKLDSSLASGFTSFVPTGAIIVFPCTVAPTGWLALSGQVISRSAPYNKLWIFAENSGNIVTDANWTSLGAYGSFSEGNGSTTFRLPDLRGYFVRGSGTHTDGTAAGTFGVKQDDEFESHNHTGTAAYTAGDGATGGDAIPTDRVFQQNRTLALTINNRGGTETRPKNIPLLYCIKI